MSTRMLGDRPEDLTLVDALVQLSFTVHHALTAAAAEQELSVTQLRLLGILRDRQPLMLDLARVLHLEKSSVSGLIDRAAKRGLVERVDAEHDGRAVHVRITAEGRRIGRRAEKRVTAEVEALAAALPEQDRTELRRIAAAIVAGPP
jgi:DNA-binding MarR family transcriptional regulator